MIDSRLTFSQHVLVADDDPAIRLVFLRLIERLSPSSTLHVAADGLAALAICIEPQPTMSITDVMMPAMDSITLTQALRAAATLTRSS